MYVLFWLLAAAALLGSSASLAQNAAGNPSIQTAAEVASPRGGTITFVGAIVVATAAAPLVGTVATLGTAVGSGHSGRLAGPSRVVSYRPLAQQEVSSQLQLLERAGETIGQPVEAVVAYR